ncbi:MAG: biotin--[acetyl-CoA-carboxylase] ligase [Deltaproteobacteria bacterium]|nr:biotin--[acetyl-CoA-carboxylase] ligase [Deltaproteobacteria bacterium]
MIEPFETPWGSKVLSFASLDSTSRYLWREAEAGAPHGTVVVADQQISGRGRRGRQWHSPAGLNLYFSVLLRPSIKLEKVPQFSLVAAAALWQGLRNKSSELTLKWPNDLFCRGLKLAGILSEMKPDSTQAEFVIIGVGLNVNAEISDFPLDLRGQVTSLKCECRRTFELAVLLENILQEFALFSEIFYREGLGGSIGDLINRNFYLADKNIVINSGSGKIKCRARAIDSNGSLLGTLADGSEVSFNAGEAWLVKGN